MNRTARVLTLFMAGLSLPAYAADVDFTAQFHGCTEFVGQQPVDLLRAQAYVPSGYTLAQPTPGRAGLIIRMAHCDGVQVNGGESEPVIIDQIGLTVLPPDGTGTIDIVSLKYAANSPRLIAAFQKAGVPAELDQDLVYERQPQDGDANLLLLTVAPAPDDSPFLLFGTETAPPPSSQELFIANWWYGANASIKEATPVPQYLSASAAISLYTSPGSLLGKLIGGDAIPSFSVFSLSGKFSDAELTVTKQDD